MFSAGCARREPGPDGVVGYAGMQAEHEDIRVRIWPAAEAIEAALDGRFRQCGDAIALLWLAARRDALRQEWTER